MIVDRCWPVLRSLRHAWGEDDLDLAPPQASLGRPFGDCCHVLRSIMPIWGRATATMTEKDQLQMSYKGFKEERSSNSMSCNIFLASDRFGPYRPTISELCAVQNMERTNFITNSCVSSVSRSCPCSWRCTGRYISCLKVSKLPSWQKAATYIYIYVLYSILYHVFNYTRQCNE